MEKKTIRLSESELRRLIERCVRRSINEVAGEDEFSRFGEFGPYIRKAAEYITNAIESNKDEYLQSAKWDEDACEFESEGYVTDYDLGIEDLPEGIESFDVNYTIEGGARETYYMSADYYHPEESSGEGEIKVYLDTMNILHSDDSYEEVNLDIMLPSIDLGW